MTENKRFIVVDVPYENEPFLYKKMLDKTTKKEYDNTLKGIDDMCDLVNKLHEENKQLKQFKEDVFNKIDIHLQMLPTARDNEFNEDDGDPSLYTGAIYMLETLKKELSE